MSLRMIAGPLLAARLPLLVLALALAGCDIKVSEEGGVSLEVMDGRAGDEWRRTYTLPAGGRLEIENINGAIEVYPSTGREIEVRATREVRSHSDDAARDILAKLGMDEEVSPDRVKVTSRTQYQEPMGPLGSRWRAAMVRYRVAIPPGLTASFTTRSGSVTLDSVTGTLSAESTNGGITGNDVSGAVKATVVNGAVQMEMVRVDGNIELKTVNGAIRLELPVDTDARLDARVLNGGVVVDERLPLAASQQARTAVSGQINAGGPLVSAQTTNGGIRIAARGSEVR